MMELLKKLSEAHGVPGSEDEVREIMKKELEKYCKVEVDALGNLIAKKGNGKKKIMLAAHMDEIGLMVKHVDKNGFLRFATLGGFFDQMLLSQRVVVHTKKGRIWGVVGSKPPHLMKEEERKKVVEYKDMFIDVGAGDEKGIKKLGIEVGDYITFDRSFKELPGNLITGKAFDARLGCAALIEIMKKVRTKHSIYAVGTIQEEVGLKGAKTAAFKINPDIAIALDVAPAGDFPGVKEEESHLKVGSGPVITIADASGRGLITHPTVKNLLIRTAEKYKIPYQLEVGEGGTTDASAIHLTREGIPSGVVSIPTRYIHSPVEVASLKDIENAVKLVTLSLENYSPMT
ncbi:MAG: M42 family metallopeptidase [Euryarchaeota archaeon]|nr:M42 family metallopeptidase [Euryarchaeota archaeon]